LLLKRDILVSKFAIKFNVSYRYIEAVFFTLTPVFFVLVDSLLVDPFFKHTYPTIQRGFARALLWLIRLKYRRIAFGGQGGLGGEGAKSRSSNGVAPAPLAVRGWRDMERDPEATMTDEAIADSLRYELGDGIMDVLSLQTPVEAVEVGGELYKLNLVDPQRVKALPPPPPQPPPPPPPPPPHPSPLVSTLEPLM
jgi:hypothetical protein